MHLQVHIRDLVDEQGPAVCDLEQPVLRSRGARERSLHVAEELVLQQLRLQAGAVERDKGLVLAFAADVQGPGDELFSRAALTLDEDRTPRVLGAFDELDDLEDRPGFADDVLLRRRDLDHLPEAGVLPDEVLLSYGVAERDLDLIDFARFLQIVICAGLDRFDRRGNRPVPREDDHG